MSARLLLAVLVCTFIGACFPMTSKYQRIEAPGARYFKSSCHGSFGPPSMVYYPYHGIFISLDITNVVSLGVHVPAQAEVTLEGKALRITGSGEEGVVDVQVPLTASPQGSAASMDPPEFRGLRDPFVSPEHFGPLIGATENGRYLWYLFMGKTHPATGPVRLLPAPRGLLRGTVELPPMTINGQHYEPQTLHFERRAFEEISAVNC